MHCHFILANFEILHDLAALGVLCPSHTPREKCLILRAPSHAASCHL